jgi:hypothetical protein
VVVLGLQRRTHTERGHLSRVLALCAPTWLRLALAQKFVGLVGILEYTEFPLPLTDHAR